MTAKTELFGRWLQGSVVVEDQSKSTGRRFFVHSGTGTNGTGYGANPERPFASLAYAVTQGVAGRHDIIRVMEGHAETIATTITPLAHTRIVGLGSGNQRPQFTPAANNLVAFTASAANVTYENLYFNECTVASAATLWRITGQHCHIRGCHWDLGANDRDVIQIGALGCYPVIEDNTVQVTANGPDTWITFTSANVDMPLIRRNHVIASDGTDAFDDGVIDFGGLAVRNPIVIHNVFDGADVGVTVLDDVGAVVGDCFSGNIYAGLATNGDTVPIGHMNIFDGAITADKIGADALTNAKFADGALSDEQLDADFTTKAGLGIRVTRAAADIFTGGTVALFTVAGGPVLVTHLQATTSVAAMAAGASNTQFLTNPTVGTDAVMCAVLDIDGDEIGTVYSITGEPATAMTGGSGGGAPAMIAPWIVAAGTIDVVSAADSGLGGALGAVELWYKPLVTGATVVAT